jgi:hypothetical protein
MAVRGLVCCQCKVHVIRPSAEESTVNGASGPFALDAFAPKIRDSKTFLIDNTKPH